MEDVILDFTDSESDNEDGNLKMCCEESDMMMLNQKKELLTLASSCPKPVFKHHKFDLRVSPSMRVILAKKLELFLDNHVEILPEHEHDIVSNDNKQLLTSKSRFKLRSGSNIEFNDSFFVDRYDSGLKRKPIPLHKPDPHQLSAAISPNYDITELLQSIK